MKFLPESFPYINEPTDSNLEDETPDKYFQLTIDENTENEA